MRTTVRSHGSVGQRAAVDTRGNSMGPRRDSLPGHGVRPSCDRAANDGVEPMEVDPPQESSAVAVGSTTGVVCEVPQLSRTPCFRQLQQYLRSTRPAPSQPPRPHSPPKHGVEPMQVDLRAPYQLPSRDTAPKDSVEPMEVDQAQ